MLRRVLTIWLILSVLGFCTAWAYDTHAGSVEHDSPSGLAGWDSPQDQDAADCDHCCHIGAHLLAMSAEVSAQTCGGRSPLIASIDGRLTNPPLGPPARPPRL